MSILRMQKLPYYGLLLLVFLVLSFIYGNLQEPIQFQNGQGFDGVKYVSMAQALRKGEPVANPGPFVYRLATPYVVSLLPISILKGFKWVNLFFALLFYLFLFRWLQIFIGRTWLAAVFVIFLMSHWAASLRFILFYPATCDPLALLCLVLGLLQLHRLRSRFSWARYLAFCIFLFFTGFVREFIMVLALAFLMYEPVFARQNTVFKIHIKKLFQNILLCLGSLTAGILGFWLAKNLVIDTSEHYGFLYAVYKWMHEKSVFQLLTAYFYVFGVSFVFFFLGYRAVLDFFKKYKYLLPVSVSALVFIWIGGGDTERFIIWFYPLFAGVLAMIIERDWSFFRRKRIYIPLILLLLFTLRPYWNIPQYDPSWSLENEQVLSQVFWITDYIDMWSYHGDKKLSTANLLFYAFLSTYFVIMYIILVKRVKLTRL